MQMMAERELRHLLASHPSSADHDALLKEAATNLETAPSRLPWKTWLYALCAVVSILAAIPMIRDYQRLRLASWRLFAMTDPLALALPGPSFGRNVNADLEKLIGDFSPQQKLLLFGSRMERGGGHFKALWDSDPENVGYFAQHFLTSIDGYDPSPPDPRDLLETADRVDPGNAWFRYIVAAVYSKDSVRRDGFKPRGSKAKAPAYTITDPAKVADAVRLIKEAARMPNYRNPYNEVILERLKILPHGEDILGRKIVDAYLEMELSVTSTYPHYLNSLLAAASKDFAARGNTGEFLSFLHAWEALQLRMPESPEFSSWPDLFRPSELAAKEVASAARDLGQHEILTRYSKIATELQQQREERRSRLEMSASAFKRAGFLATRLALQAERGENPPPLRDEDLKPGRMASQAMLGRIHSLLGWFAIGLVAMLGASVRFRHGRQARMLSKSLEEVLKPQDYVWIFGMGILLPFLLHQVVEHFTSFGGGSFSPFTTIMADFARNVVVAGLMLTLGSRLITWRLARRMKCLGWNYGRTISTIALSAGSTLWIASSILSSLGDDSDPNLTKAVPWLLGVLIFGAIGIPIAVLFRGRERAVQWLAASRAMTPATMFAMLLMALSIPTNHEAEKYWTKRDTLTVIDPTVPAQTRYDYEMQKTINAEVLEFLRRQR
ncbi:hypothetical protein [Luteolibacter luteus]|uniref:Uncharacterized protein n=1 Tax=Luteolibacter luteus TaxID=2728835 RepID=A0A858RIG4_9BACT|nr:hypothetical protein [Luteolibacter luteus]QJE97006.1 hypothetical protein HHL09_14835 [Luteolibacter luteus]